MCGFTCIVSKTGDCRHKDCDSMLQTIRHRGPDSYGNLSVGNVHLGHVRLSIIDLSNRSNQPLSSNDGKHLVFNGEIYNYKEISSTFGLQDRISDTTTLLEFLSKRPIDEVLSNLNGMFSFIYFDSKEKKLFACRDRFGIKPLYFYEDDTAIYFASELKAFTTLHTFRPRLNRELLPEYLMFRHTRSTDTLLHGVKKIGPGEILSVSLQASDKPNKICNRQYWNGLDLAKTSNINKNLLENAVGLNCISDVLLGVMYSAGVDSSVILSFLDENRLDAHTFTAVDQHSDKVKAEQILLKKNKFTSHFVDNQACTISELRKLVYYLDEPTPAPVIMPTNAIAKKCNRENIKVLLSGEGADEFFVGYDKMKLFTLLSLFEKNKFFRIVLRWIIKVCPKGLLSEKNKTELMLRMRNNAPLFWGNSLDFTSEEIVSLLGLEINPVKLNNLIFRDNILPYYESFNTSKDKFSPLKWPIFLESVRRIPNLICNRLDKTLMQHSVEGRVPFLDHRLYEFAMGQKGFKFFKNCFNKNFIRRSHLSKRIGVSHLKKAGFTVKLNKQGTLFHDGKAFIIRSNRYNKLFNQSYLEKILTAEDRRFFNILALFLWIDVFIATNSPNDD